MLVSAIISLIWHQNYKQQKQIERERLVSSSKDTNLKCWWRSIAMEKHHCNPLQWLESHDMYTTQLATTFHFQFNSVQSANICFLSPVVSFLTEVVPYRCLFWCFYILTIQHIAWLLEARLGQWQHPLYPNMIDVPKSPPAGKRRSVSNINVKFATLYCCQQYSHIQLSKTPG